MPLRCDCPGRQTALDDVQGSVGRELLQTERRLPLAHLNLCLGELMPVDKDVRAGKSSAAGRNAIAVLEIAFDFEVELLGKVAG